MSMAREKGEHERGDYFPLLLRGLGVSPDIFFFNFEPFYVRFNGGFMC